MTSDLGTTLANYLTEREMQDGIRMAALSAGWAFYHTHDSRRSDPGFPDCIIVRDGRILALELKAQRGRVRPRQRWWLDRLATVPGVTAAVVRPVPRPGELSYDAVIDLIGGGV